jgi:nucleotide-binding universal stress UspA family protein
MSETSLGKVLLATDGSEDATLAARVAADIAATTGREIHIVHVLESLPRYAYPGITPEIYSLVHDKRRARAGELLAPTRAPRSTFKVSLMVY